MTIPMLSDHSGLIKGTNRPPKSKGNGERKGQAALPLTIKGGVGEMRGPSTNALA